MKRIGKQSPSRVGFADLYLERYGSGPLEILPKPDPDLFLIVTIPAFKEPDLSSSLLSLISCDPPGVKWEILININYPENSDETVVVISQQSLTACQQLSKSLNRDDLQIHCLWNPDMPRRHAGVGLARKKAMDQAIYRFNTIGQPNGVIVSFDADSRCDKGYLRSIANFYLQNPGVRTANIYYEHPLHGDLPPGYYHSITQYELYLRYMRLAIETTGHPYSIHTVGSSFSTRAKTYIRVNGMGCYKAGEDFYFLHKCIQLKNFWEINDTTVRPSVRESDRVSFGTGASITRLQSEVNLAVYNLDSFSPIRELFRQIGSFWRMEDKELQSFGEWESISEGLAEFMTNQGALNKIQEMRCYSASEQTFCDKFFGWFNGFMILRYLNEVHKHTYVKMPVLEEALRLALILGIDSGESAGDLLENYRDYEKGRGNRRII